MGADFEAQLLAAEERIAAAGQGEGDLELRDALAAKAELHRAHGDEENFRRLYVQAAEKTPGAAKQLDFQLAVLHSYFAEGRAEAAEWLRLCQRLNAETADWEKKNKLAVYEGLLALQQRELARAARLFLGCVNTFNAGEVLPFEQLVGYAALLGLLTLPRREVAEKVVESAEVRAVLNDCPPLNDLLLALYRSRYGQFFPALLAVVEGVVRPDPRLRPLEPLLLGRARLAVYAQYLEAYRTVRLEKMARDFGLSPAFLDRELAGLIAARKLHCRIDLLAGTVESSPANQRMTLTAELLAKADGVAERLSQLVALAQQ